MATALVLVRQLELCPPVACAIVTEKDARGLDVDDFDHWMRRWLENYQKELIADMPEFKNAKFYVYALDVTV